MKNNSNAKMQTAIRAVWANGKDLASRFFSILSMNPSKEAVKAAASDFVGEAVQKAVDKTEAQAKKDIGSTTQSVISHIQDLSRQASEKLGNLKTAATEKASSLVGSLFDKTEAIAAGVKTRFDGFKQKINFADDPTGYIKSKLVNLQKEQETSFSFGRFLKILVLNILSFISAILFPPATEPVADLSGTLAAASFTQHDPAQVVEKVAQNQGLSNNLVKS
ncbi:MAG: hypothetical protein FJ186_05365 [Gammaproteobacteria bacterium]|nr:hypothetical protein [Gammaproteobacteria bacterium]